MREYIELGSTPYQEKCAQVGTENYVERAIEECERYIALLEKRFPQAAEIGVRFRRKAFLAIFSNDGKAVSIQCQWR